MTAHQVVGAVVEVFMDDTNIIMEEYVRLKEEKARRQGRTFNWQTATYGKMEYYENKDDSFTNLETKYPTIVFDDTSDPALSCEPTNDKVNTPSSPSPEPMIGYIDDLDFFKQFKNKFPAIAYSDLKSKSDQRIEPSTLYTAYRTPLDMALHTAYPRVWDTAY
uniref:Uncharacterized protein n=1 Tax=Tanacetum cinerariifolium TaxID=118510 RepID=A0A6L2KXC8_TANCI|nr:hypothetical protein [Tanacetum cinerariifolium]